MGHIHCPKTPVGLYNFASLCFWIRHLKYWPVIILYLYYLTNAMVLGSQWVPLLFYDVCFVFFIWYVYERFVFYPMNQLKMYCPSIKGNVFVCFVCRDLTIEDQISLLKGSAFEIVQMRFNMLFNENTGIWECGSLKYCMNDAQRGESQHSARHKPLLSAFWETSSGDHSFLVKRTGTWNTCLYEWIERTLEQ